MQLSLDDAQFFANRLVLMGIPLLLAAGVGALLLLSFYIRKRVNKLTRQDLNIVRKILCLLSLEKHSSRYRCTSCRIEAELKSCNHDPTAKEVLLRPVYSNIAL